MAKQPKKEGFSIKGFDAQAYKQTEAYVQAIDVLYNQAIMEFAQLATQAKINQDKPFAFKDYPATQAKVQQIVNSLAAKMQAVITKGSREQWLYACKKNDEFIASILNTSKISKAKLDKMQDRNLEALKTFQGRKVNGMDLSQRVWKYTGQLKTTMELGIDVAIGKGTSAAALSRELRKYLKEPDNLFRKVKDKHGNLVLSKAAKALHPGQGVYRSSCRNAMRLTRSEINLAYKEADQLRWQQLDFVVGYEIKLSNNHTLNGEPFVDICDKLAGRYPKSFRFKGWHPQCRCLVVPILQDREEFNDDELADLKSALNGKEYKKYASKSAVTDVPDSFKEWIQENAERSRNWASQPYFIKENFKGGTIDGGLNFMSKLDGQSLKGSVVENKFELPVTKKDVAVERSNQIDEVERAIREAMRKIEELGRQLKTAANNLQFDTYKKAFKPGQPIPEKITRDDGREFVYDSKFEDTYAGKVVAEYRYYKSEQASSSILQKNLDKTQAKLTENQERLQKLKSGELDNAIQKEIENKLMEKRADDVFYKYVADEKLVPDIAKAVYDELGGVEKFKAKNTNTNYVKTKDGSKIRVSDHESRTEQSDMAGAKDRFKPVEFDSEDVNVMFDKDSRGLYIKVGYDYYYIHEYNINSRQDIIDFVLQKLKKLGFKPV